jgi:hypothetical protein
MGVPPGASGTPLTSGKATAALILGILGVLSCQVLGIAAIILGNEATAEIAASEGRLGGEQLAKVGIILGWIGVALLALVIVVVTFGLLFVGLFAVASA